MRVKKQRILVLFLLLLSPVAASGQSTLEGEMGTDVGINNFSNYLQKSARDYSVNRGLSKQYLDLRYGGPLVTEDFADLLVRARIAGTYYHVRSENEGTAETQSEYIDPVLDNAMLSFSLFPLRTYPFHYAFGKVETNTIRYEPGRRADTELVKPDLAVVRRYNTDVLSHSAQWQAALAKDVNFSTEFKHEQSEVRRQYDFDENKDIWMSFTSQTLDPVSPTHRVDVFNRLNDNVILLIDFIVVDSLSAGERITLNVEKGKHEIDVIPTNFNAFHATVDVQAAMQWRIAYTPPKGSSDRDQTTNSAESVLRLGNREGRLRSETRFLHSDIDENVQEMTSVLNSVNNVASYDFNPRLGVQFLTTYGSTDTDISDISSQKNSSFLQQTQGRWQKRDGPSASLLHAYNRMRSVTNGDDLRSRTHLLNGLTSIPTSLPGHWVDLRATGTFLADNRDYVNNQYITGIINKFEVRTGRFKLRPQHELKYARSTVKTRVAETTAQETESRTRLEVERPVLRWLGDLRVKAEWEWRSRDTVAELETKNRYFGELGLVKKFSRKLRLMATASKETEVYSAEAKDGVAAGDLDVKTRPNQDRLMYRMDLQVQPWTAMTFNALGMIIEQNRSQISRITLSLSGRPPGVDLPIRSFLVAESKELEGLPGQSLLQMETQVSYRFRQISFVLAFSVYKEKLIAEDYTYTEVYAKISRAFGIF